MRMSHRSNRQGKTVRTYAVWFVVAIVDRQIGGGIPKVREIEGAIFNHRIVELPSIFIIPRPAWDEEKDAFTYKYIGPIVEKPLR